MGLDHVDIHLRPITGAGDQNALLMAQRIQQIDPTLRQHGMTYTLDVEAPNFSPSAEITPGINEYNHPGGFDRWDLRAEWLKAVLPPAAQSPPAFQGLVNDECDHMQLSNNELSNPPHLTCQSARPRIGAEGAFAPHGQSHRSSLLDTAMRWPLGWGCSLCGREDPAWPPRRTRGDYGGRRGGGTSSVLSWEGKKLHQQSTFRSLHNPLANTCLLASKDFRPAQEIAPSCSTTLPSHEEEITMKRLSCILCLVVVFALSAVGQDKRSRDLYLSYESGNSSGGQPGAKVMVALNRTGTIQMVSPDTVFRSGDKVRFHLSLNFNGYLAVLNKGTSGRINRLYPYLGAPNRAQASAEIVVPGKEAWFAFDETPGIEEVTFLMSKDPIEEVKEPIPGTSASQGQESSPGSSVDGNGQRSLVALNKRARQQARDLHLEISDNAAYGVASEKDLSGLVKFTVFLKHER